MTLLCGERIVSDDPHQRTRGATDDRRCRVRASPTAVLCRVQFSNGHGRHQGRAGLLQHERLSVGAHRRHEISRNLAQVSRFDLLVDTFGGASSPGRVGGRS